MTVASYGEVKFVLLGVLLQLAAVGAESMRLILVQILLQACLEQAVKLLWKVDDMTTASLMACRVVQSARQL